MTLNDINKLTISEEGIYYPKSIPNSLKRFYEDYYKNGCGEWYELENYSGNKISEVFEILRKGPNILSFLEDEVDHWLGEVEENEVIPDFILHEFPNLKYYDYYDENCSFVKERFGKVLQGWFKTDKNLILLIECFEVVRYLETASNIVFDDKETFEVNTTKRENEIMRQAISDFIEKQQNDGLEGGLTKANKEKKVAKSKVIEMDSLKKEELLNRLSKFVDSYNHSSGFKFVNVRVLLGDDFSEHPAIRDQDKVLSFHSSYKYSYENISCFAIAPSCFFTIEVGAETFTIIYLNVGIEDQWEDCEVFVGITSETMKPLFTTSFMRENILWFHEINAPDRKLIERIIALGEVLTNEDASTDIFGFFDTYPGIPDSFITWESLDDLDW